MQDASNHYNMVSSGEQDFQVISGTNSSIKLGWQSYTPPSNASGEFWLMAFDRVALQPINTYSIPDGLGTKVDCAYTQASQSCGYLFNTHKDGGVALGQVLSSISPRNLIALTTVGCPFSSTDTTPISSSFANSLQLIGGMRHSPDFWNDTANYCNYALVSVNDGKHMFYNSNAALSWNYISAQKQLGAIDGYVAVGQDGLYDVAGKDQMQKDPDSGDFYATANDTFEHLASQSRQDWPMTDSTGHLAAYHDISEQLLTDAEVNKTGGHDYDVRYFYTAIDDVTAYNLTGLIDSRLDVKTATNPVTQSSWDTATSVEFNDVREEIENELKWLRSSVNYFTGTDGKGGVRGELDGATDTIFADAVGVADAIGKDAVLSTTNTTVNTNTSDWLNLAAGITSTLVPLIDAEAFPEAQMLMSVASGSLWTGSAALTPLAPHHGYIDHSWAGNDIRRSIGGPCQPCK